MILINNSRNLLITSNKYLTSIRNASKKTSGSTKNPQDPHNRPKHRGWKRQDGHNVVTGTILATQTKPRFFPGLNVGFGRNGTLFAYCDGKVVVTCEKVTPNFDHPSVQRFFANRGDQPFFKKYFNVIPEKQHQRFVLVDEN